ncbi:OapA family protein [Entomohabitans teleogrylli]|uniref:OapA family protein n=1 Tax=Entomohabitans teleogrylli TaxID=1384589 RepID=UPI00073D7743|nr:LysM-like peptidoglycan-binding domain-containing protein [Entomohabitans teleogrylli]
MPVRFAIKPLLTRIWHAPDNIRLMDPLPPPHRRGIIIAALVMVVGFLWPSPDTPSGPAVTRETPLNLPGQPPAAQPEIVSPDPTANQPVAPIDPQPVQEEQPDDSPPPAAQNNNEQQQWRSYQIEAGKTLAQVFRDHNLPPADVYAMAQVEGAGKPLSNLRSGQVVQIRQDSRGVVTGLMVDIGNGQQALFTRQPGGNFIRAQ